MVDHYEVSIVREDGTEYVSECTFPTRDSAEAFAERALYCQDCSSYRIVSVMVEPY